MPLISFNPAFNGSFSPSFKPTDLAFGSSLPTIMRVATVLNRLPDGVTSQSGNDTYVTRFQHTVAQDMQDLVLSFSNFYLSSSETNGGNAYTISEVSIESSGGTVVAVNFSGSRSKVVNDGDVDIQSDAIEPSDFSLSRFTKGETYWIKCKITVTAGNNVPETASFTSYTGAQAYWLASGSTTITNDVDDSGAFTFSGGSPVSKPQGYSPIVLGKPYVDGSTFLVVGDSIGETANDDNTNDPLGRGFIQRSMTTVAGSSVDLLPCLNFSKYAISSLGYAGSNTKWRNYIQYARYAIDQLGTNDVGGLSLSTVQTRLRAIWTILNDGGIERIYRTSLLARTTSSDSWATLANQSYVDGTTWQPDGVVDQANTWFKQEEGDEIYAFIDFQSTTIDSATRKWLVDGTANYASNDGVHPSPAFCELMAVGTRTSLRTPVVLSAVNITAPVVSGTAGVGELLTTTNGTWSNSPSSFAYQWYRDGVAISGATSSTYTTVASDDGTDVTCGVTPSSPSGTEATSNAISLVSIAWDLILDATVGVTHSSGAVSEWADQSGNDYHATPPSGREPVTGTRTQNSLNVIDFIEGDLLSYADTTETAQPQTIILCASLDAIGGFKVMYASGGSSTFQRLWHISDYLTAHCGNWDSSAPKQAAGEFDIWVFNINGASTKVWKNGGAATTINAGTDAGTIGYTLMSKDLEIDNLSDGVIGEVRRVQSLLSLADINTTCSALATKWGTTWTTAT